LPKGVQPPYPAVIPVAKATAILVEGTPDSLQPSTTGAPAAGLNDSPSFLSGLSGAKNLIGLVLLGVIVLLLVRIFRPVSGKQKNQNRTPR
jgi:hypothetical protein